MTIIRKGAKDHVCERAGQATRGSRSRSRSRHSSVCLSPGGKLKAKRNKLRAQDQGGTRDQEAEATYFLCTD